MAVLFALDASTHHKIYKIYDKVQGGFFMKAQKFDLILNLDLMHSLYVKSKLEIKAKFLTFFENLNFSS